MSLNPFVRWNTGRIITSDDTLITEYAASELPTLTAANKVISIAPAPAVAFRFFGRDAANETAQITIAGWMDNDDPGPGQRLCLINAILGAKDITEAVIAKDNKWSASKTWLECDTLTMLYRAPGTGVFDVTTDADYVNLESILILPTLGYVNLSVEMTVGTAAEFGFIYRPVMTIQSSLALSIGNAVV